MSTTPGQRADGTPLIALRGVDVALGGATVLRGVNWTLGLPFIRTSPDHGTAYDIAGQNKADPSSMLAALRLAKQLARVRR